MPYEVYGPMEPFNHADTHLLDIISDAKIPGYQVWRRGGDRSTAMAVRIPRQIFGWKAVLMDASGLFDAEFMQAENIKKARRRSKALGKQGWEVRQEPLKNSYDFRLGACISATMHAGSRLFKHEWHVLAKDGSKYVWRMDKHGLALFREEDNIKVAEFRKALSIALASAVSSSSSSALYRNSQSGSSLDMTRIGSLIFVRPPALATSSRAGPGILDVDLALASLMAVFHARKGPQGLTAAYEPSNDPLRQKLEQERQEAPDREEVMLAMPRPGFARDRGSIMSTMSDTTDEDADTTTSDASPDEAARAYRRDRSEERSRTEAEQIAQRYRRQSIFAGC